MENNWKEFYKNRINSTYQNYFEKKYRPFLEYINSQDDLLMLEAGCGIGSVSKYLHKQGKISDGFDLCPYMVDLANKNTDTKVFKQGDIFKKSNNYFLTITHGVLEHFSNEKIIEFIERYPNSINYVPLDKYITPSFGDERLLSKEYWLELIKPDYYLTFNDGYDLMFHKKQN